MTTSESASPRTSTPSQKLALPRSTALPSRRKRSSSSLREPSPWSIRGNPSDGERRRVQPKRVTEYLDPPDQIGAAVVAPAFEQGLGRPGALSAARKTLAAFGEQVEGRAYRA